MKNNIKLLSIILTALLLFAAIPFAAFAEEIEADTEIVDETEVPSETSDEVEETEVPAFPLPEGNENVSYELISKNTVKVTV